MIVFVKLFINTSYVLDLFWAVTNIPNGCDPKPESVLSPEDTTFK
jgi:hypothetical protein